VSGGELDVEGWIPRTFDCDGPARCRVVDLDAPVSAHKVIEIQ
jgi:hypothetical protein